MNVVILIGNLGKDPELKHFEGGAAVCLCTLATSETYKNKAGELVTDTTWHNLEIWGKRAETFEKYMKKGSKVSIRGKYFNVPYEDSEGVKKVAYKVKVEDFLFLDSKSDQ